ncbi:chymotrypsin-like elastase family member 2A [Daphnia carinata]|uniref:chymotrypsin-like elastase family member 2A n=1 Tax=Daphnia carinata TaxID=120202 RepID=UPI00257B68BC|nr:chymotrypsin-like elastase family member 2A [Daphnia carinata]
MEIRCVLPFILSLLCSSKSGSIYQTQDLVIIKDPFEPENIVNGRHQNWMAKENDDAHFSFRPNFYHSQANVFTGSQRQNNTTLMDERSCYTAEGRFGSCMPLRSCYPASKLPQLSNLQVWTMITRIPCSYAVTDGRQIQGICCLNEEVFNPPSVFVEVRAMPSTPPFGVPYSFNYPVVPHPIAASAKTKASPKSENPPSSPLTEGAMAQRKLIGCGVGPAKISSHDGHRIIGGTAAVKNSWPAMVAIKYAGTFFCSGTLISPTKVLTTAYCVKVRQPWDFYLITIELGAHAMYPTSDAPVSRRISGLARHRSYNRDKVLNDIGIFMLKVPVIYTNTMSPVCLPPAGTTDTYADKNAFIVGWGSLEYNPDLLPANVLQQVGVKIISNADCQTAYNDLQVTIENSVICVQTDNPTCWGDYGGPLLVRSSPTAPWTQVGIITDTFSNICSVTSRPVRYTRVSSFSSWISART